MNAALPKLVLGPAEAVVATDSPVGHVPHITVGTFCETPGSLAVISAAAEDRRLSRAVTANSMGGIPQAIAFCRSHPTPDLLLLESSSPRDALLAQLDELATVCDAATKVVVIGRSNDVSLYRDLMDRGISDYIVGPTETLMVIAAVLRLFTRAGAVKPGGICAFIGAKGGVGSSVIAQNLGWNIAQELARPVLLADMDLQFGSVSLNLNLETASGFADQLGGAARKDDVGRLDDGLFNRLLVRRGRFLSVLPSGNAMRVVSEPGPEILNRMLELAQASFTVAVLDLPHAWTPWVRGALAAADEVIITAEPDLGNLRNAKRLIDLLRTLRPNDGPPRLVLNKVGVPARKEIKTTEFAAALQIEASATFAFEPRCFSSASNSGQLLAETATRTTSKRPFASLVQALVDRKDAPPKPATPARFWRR
ncbi:AAA family ATPase [Paracoccaceae bacterium Fryx2]|nr:AAA family ATPase [Paracoccaceae bacterium Fryx2]